VVTQKHRNFFVEFKQLQVKCWQIEISQSNTTVGNVLAQAQM